MLSIAMQKVYVVVGTLILLGFLGYRLYTEEPVIINSPDYSSTEIVGQDILTLVEKLRSISADVSFLSGTSSSLLSNLVDYSISLYPESAGRPNPFSRYSSEGSFGARNSTR